MIYSGKEAKIQKVLRFNKRGDRDEIVFLVSSGFTPSLVLSGVRTESVEDYDQTDGTVKDTGLSIGDSCRWSIPISLKLWWCILY